MPNPAPNGPAVAALQADARNRALRTFLQGLAWDLLTAVAVVVYSVLNAGGDTVAWSVLGAALVKTVLTTAASYVMRVKLDASALPTPLPPADPGPPSEDETHTATAVVAAGVVAGVTLVGPAQEDGVADHGLEGPRSEAARAARLNEPTEFG